MFGIEFDNDGRVKYYPAIVVGAYIFLKTGNIVKTKAIQEFYEDLQIQH